MFLLDSHCDTPTQLYRTRDLCLNVGEGHVDFKRLRAGGVDAPFFAIYIPKEMDSDEAFEYAGKLISCTKKYVEENSEIACLATNAEQALENKQKGLISVFLGLENASPIGTDMGRLEWFYNQGVRYITLCHNADNMVCDSAAQASTHHGLSGFGRELVARMNEMGMIIDCAHISDESFWDLIKYSTKPFVSTHSCCRALAGHRRNMTDEMIKALAQKGGVIQINFYPVFLDSTYNEEDLSAPRPSYTLVADHIDHVVKLVGIDHVGIGSDFDGIDVTPDGLEDVSKIGVVFDELRRRGYSSEELQKIAGGNFMRVMRLCGVS